MRKYYYLGNNIDLIKKEHINNKILKYQFKNDKLLVETNTNNSFTDDDLFFVWLKQQAEIYIPPKVKELAKKYHFEYEGVQIKNLNSRWGSCSINKKLSFNLKLMYFNYDVINYVIIHELCHLEEMNHSVKFWKLVKRIVPDYSIHRKELNKIIL